jgi:hypothetical protein
VTQYLLDLSAPDLAGIVAGIVGPPSLLDPFALLLMSDRTSLSSRRRSRGHSTRSTSWSTSRCTRSEEPSTNSAFEPNIVVHARDACKGLLACMHCSTAEERQCATADTPAQLGRPVQCTRHDHLAWLSDLSVAACCWLHTLVLLTEVH